MAYSSDFFPSIKLLTGFTKSIRNPISVIGNGTNEYRVKKQKFPKYTWSIPTRNMNEADKQEIIAFFGKRDGALDSFQFLDPDENKLVDAIMSNQSGDTWYFNIPHDTTTAGTHPIFHFANLTAKINGSPATIASTSVLATGEPVIQVTGSIPTDTVTISGDLFFAARLDSSNEWNLRAFDGSNNTVISNMSSITLQEVFEF